MCAARSRASVVFPEPGGPQKTTDPISPASSERRRSEPSPTRWSWPTNSVRVRGRMRSASGTLAARPRDGTSPGSNRSMGSVAKTGNRLPARPDRKPGHRFADEAQALLEVFHRVRVGEPDVPLAEGTERRPRKNRDTRVVQQVIGKLLRTHPQFLHVRERVEGAPRGPAADPL